MRAATSPYKDGCQCTAVVEFRRRYSWALDNNHRARGEAMSSAIAIRILEKDNNRRGDLFGRLMSDLFLSLGYDDVRLNIAHSGREIDIEAEHRVERRLAMAECKALKAKAGGKEINTLAGKLRPEQRKHPGVSITPYFIPLSGFTETSVDQEDESGEDAIILVDGPRIIIELIKGRILVPLEKATEKAGQCTAGLKRLVLDEGAEILAHDRGWFWAVYYTQGKQRTHIVLVHADGTPVAASMARDIIEADRTVGGTMHKLACLNPEPVIAPNTDQQIAAALAKYSEYLNAECGYILLDGLPADAEVGSQRLRLENLFVPLHLIVANRTDGPLASEAGAENVDVPASNRCPVGEVFATHSRLAILASPGGGKSTLVKRLAIAYADPDRRRLTEDHLPDRSWLPLFFRCRELRDKTRAPFSELVDALAARAYMGELSDAFRAYVDRTLRNGEVLLLVDGLDEISDAGDRAAFVRNLRTLLAVYPNVSLVVTSREAGFRQVAGLLAAVCLNTRLADFDADDVRRLSVAWHREILGDRPDVIADAERLASTIAANDRIRLLAVNPLLLTTLLLVKRWVGQLPTRRSILYGKAVEVLLMTWNVEGHDPIEQDEALPQLCYVAYSMMQHGVQKISRPDLTRRLEVVRRCEGALGTMFVAYRICCLQNGGEPITCQALLGRCADALVSLLFSENSSEQFAACWALAWIGGCRVWTPPLSPNVLDRLFALWLRSSIAEIRKQAAWTFACLPLLPREAEPLRAWLEVEEFVTLAKRYDHLEDSLKEKPAILVAAYYLQSPWSDAELGRLAREISKDPISVRQTLRDLMVALNVEDIKVSQGGRRPGKRRPRQ
jgi:hypothetical protein